MKRYRHAYYFWFYWKVHIKFLYLLYLCNHSKYFRKIVKSTYLLHSSHKILNDQFIQERINGIKNPQLSIETGRWNKILINTCNRNNIEITLRFTGKLLPTNFTLSLKCKTYPYLERRFFVFSFMYQMWKVTLKIYELFILLSL